MGLHHQSRHRKPADAGCYQPQQNSLFRFREGPCLKGVRHKTIEDPDISLCSYTGTGTHTLTYMCTHKHHIFKKIVTLVLVTFCYCPKESTWPGKGWFGSHVPCALHHWWKSGQAGAQAGAEAGTSEEGCLLECFQAHVYLLSYPTQDLLPMNSPTRSGIGPTSSISNQESTPTNMPIVYLMDTILNWGLLFPGVSSLYWVGKKCPTQPVR